MTSNSRNPRQRALRAATVTLAGAGIAVTGAGAAFAAAPHSVVGHAVHDAAGAVGITIGGTDYYTQDEYDAFWAKDYSAEDIAQLEQLWGLDESHTKAHAGELLLAGKALPFAPGTYTTPAPSADETAKYEAAIDAGYNDADIDQLATLWNLDWLEAKAHAGELLLAGQDVPVPPSGIENPVAPDAGAVKGK